MPPAELVSSVVNPRMFVASWELRPPPVQSRWFFSQWQRVSGDNDSWWRRPSPLLRGALRWRMDGRGPRAIVGASPGEVLTDTPSTAVSIYSPVVGVFVCSFPSSLSRLTAEVAHGLLPRTRSVRVLALAVLDTSETHF